MKKLDEEIRSVKIGLLKNKLAQLDEAMRKKDDIDTFIKLIQQNIDELRKELEIYENRNKKMG